MWLFQWFTNVFTPHLRPLITLGMPLSWLWEKKLTAVVGFWQNLIPCHFFGGYLERFAKYHGSLPSNAGLGQHLTHIVTFKNLMVTYKCRIHNEELVEKTSVSESLQNQNIESFLIISKGNNLNLGYSSSQNKIFAYTSQIFGNFTV